MNEEQKNLIKRPTSSDLQQCSGLMTLAQIGDNK